MNNEVVVANAADQAAKAVVENPEAAKVAGDVIAKAAPAGGNGNAVLGIVIIAGVAIAVERAVCWAWGFGKRKINDRRAAKQQAKEAANNAAEDQEQQAE